MGPRPTRRVSVENPVGQGPRALPQGNGMIPREPPVGAAVLSGPLPRRNKKPEADRRSASGGIVEYNYFLISPLAAAVR